MAAMRTTLVLFAIVALAAAVPVAKTPETFSYFEAMKRRSFSSGFSSGYTSSSAYTSTGATPTPAPTLAPGTTTIKQVVTIDFGAGVTASNFAGSASQTMANFGYGKEIGIVDSSDTATTYKTGCSVTSSASRRAAITVAFTAVVTPALSDAATTAANGMTAATLGATMAAVLTNLKVHSAGTYSGLSNPTVSAVAAPTITTAGTTTSSASSVATFSGVAFAIAAVAAIRR